MERKLKIILCVVIVILIALVSFIGVYTKDTVLFKNNLPDYLLSSDFEGKRITSFVIDDSTEDIIYDKDGKKVDSIPEGANKDDYTQETKKVNSDENRRTENYKKVKEIFDGRLKSLNVSDYKVRLNESTGNVTVELEDNINTDELIQYLLCTGDFSIKDSKEGNVLLDKSDIKDAKVIYSNATSEGVRVYLDIIFNKEGTQKLREVSREYKKTEENNSDEENKEENDNQKKVTLTIEGQDMMTTSFEDELREGELTISLGSSKDADTLQTYVDQGRFYAMLINNHEMPLKYTMQTTETVEGNLSLNDMYILIGLITLIFVIIVIYMICRFKIDGVFAGISIISAIAILLLAIRYTNTEISLNAIMAIIILMILNAYLMNKILSKIKNDESYENVSKATLNTYLEQIEVIIVILALAIIFTFMSHIQIFSFGMTLFYGAISIAISNLIFFRTMLLAKYSNN